MNGLKTPGESLALLMQILETIYLFIGGNILQCDQVTGLTPGESLVLLKANPLNNMYCLKGKLYRNGTK